MYIPLYPFIQVAAPCSGAIGGFVYKKLSMSNDLDRELKFGIVSLRVGFVSFGSKSGAQFSMERLRGPHIPWPLHGALNTESPPKLKHKKYQK